MKYKDYLETLSAGTDDCADAQSVLTAVDRVGRQHWDDYHLIGLCLKNNDSHLGLALDTKRRSELRKALFTARLKAADAHSECATDLSPAIKHAVKQVATPQSVRSTTPPSNQSWFSYTAAVVGAVALAGFGVLMQSATSFDNTFATRATPTANAVSVVQPDAAKILNASYAVATDALASINSTAPAVSNGVTPVVQRRSASAEIFSSGTASY